MSGKVVLISGTVALLAVGTGISLAATQSSSSADSVTCIVTVDAKAAVDANSALSDVFPVGTPLHLTSAGREVDVTVSAPLTAAAPPATTAPTTAPATADPSASATADPTTAPPTGATSAPPTGATSAPATGATSAPAGGATSAPASGKPGKKHHHHRPTRKATKPAAKPTASAAKAETNAEKAAQVGKVSIKAASNKGVDPNTVCVELSKNAFNILGNVANGNNVGAFLATMTQSAAGASASAGSGAGAGGGQASASAAPTATATASASASAGTKGGKTHHKNHH